MLSANTVWPRSYFKLYNALKAIVTDILLYVIAKGIFAREKYVQKTLQRQYNSVNR